MALGRDQAIRDLEKKIEKYAERSDERSEKHLRIAAERLKLALIAIVASVALQVVGIGVNIWLNLAD